MLYSIYKFLLIILVIIIVYQSPYASGLFSFPRFTNQTRRLCLVIILHLRFPVLRPSTLCSVVRLTTSVY